MRIPGSFIPPRDTAKVTQRTASTNVPRTKNVMAWLFLTMTQPEPVEGTVAWFWGLACHMFTTLGLFESLTKDCGGHEGALPGYVPKQFVHIGEFTAKDIARHFYDCGMTARMASTIFWDFAKGYVEQCPTAEEPAWASVPAPRERETREHPAKRRRVHKKGNKARKQTAAPKTLAERIGEEAIQWAIIKGVSNPIFFIDNKAVLTSFLDLNTHSSQMSSIRINALIHDFLSTTDNVMSFAYCPSHVGIEGNERADQLTKKGAAMGPTVPTRMLRSNFINDFKQEMTTHWRVLSHSQTYKGHGWLPIRRKRRIFKPSIRSKTAKNFFLTLSGNNIETFSCMARAPTGHAPTGEYRQRFHPDLPTYCKHCGPTTEHTRAHIFTSCSSYVPLAPSITDWKRNRENDKVWKSFFQTNPSAFSFGDLPEDVH